MKNESVVVGQRNRIGGEVIQLGLFEAERRLNLATGLLLAQNVGDVIGAKGASRLCFGHCGGNRFWTVLTNKMEHFGDLARQRTIGLC